jgi:cation diffusion facilitator family transporter
MMSNHPTQNSTKTDNSPAWRQEKAVRLNLFLDLGMFVPVLTVAVLANSMLLLTDFFEYAKWIVSSLISWLILRRIRQGHTEEYEYGSEKIEVLGSLFIACLMLAGVAVMAGAIIHRLISPQPVVPAFGMLAILVHLGGTGLNAWLWFRNKRIAEETAGPILDATWRAHRADTFMSIGVIASLALTLSLRHLPWAIYIDPACALAALLYPAGGFVSILRSTLADLSDRTLDESVQMQIMKRLAECYDGYETFHGVKTRRAGRRSFIEIKLGFHTDRTVGEVMDTIDHLKSGLESDIPDVEVSVVLAQAEKLFDGHSAKTQIRIVPLSPATLKQAVELITTTFRLTPDEVPLQELEESVEPGLHTAALAEKGISDPRYWVALHHGHVTGLTGIYFSANDREEAVWGGWTVYDASLRSSVSRAKKLMLQKMLIEARATGRRLLRLYTSTAPAEAAANRLYDRAGLKVYRTEPLPDGTGIVLYRQAAIAELYQHAQL